GQRDEGGTRRHADGGADGDVAAAGLDVGLGEGGADAFGDIERAGDIRLGQQHDELLAAEASGGVDVADAALDDTGGTAEHVVAGLVAEAVVNALEVVEIDDEERERAA